MSLKDDLLKHQIFLQRLGASHGANILSVLQKAIEYVISVSDKKPDGFSRSELRTLQASIVKTLHTIASSQIKGLMPLALYEADFIVDRLFRNGTLNNVNKPSAEQISEAVSKIKMALYNNGKKHTLEKTFLTFANIKASEIIMKVSDISVSGKDNKPALVAGALTSLGVGLFATQALTLGKTAVTQTSSVARQEVYKENDIPLVDWVTELDSDVCPDCESLGSGGPYNVTDSDIPPEHWNCRCVLVPSDEQV